MNIKPKNSWILVEIVNKVEEKREESVVLLPEDYKKPESPYSVTKVLEDPESVYQDCNVVVPTHIIRNIQIGSETFYLIERSHIMASIEKEE
jgi:co-chaperonin GroES (HSP10)